MTHAPDPGFDPDDTASGPTLVFDSQTMAHSIPEDILGILTGTFAASLGLYLLQASQAVTGGTAGLALLVDYATTWPFWLIFALVNLPFAALAIWQKGWDFTIRTAISIALVSGFSVVNHALFDIAAIDPIYGTLGGNLLAGVGLLILFRHRASLGGVNIIALVVQERTGFRAGWTQLVFDVLIIAGALFVVPWPNVLMSAAGAVLLSLVLAMNHRPGRYIGH
ncbi:YitT family protein [Microbacterium terricola]|uniref:Membrane protein n=1 Tax=Microbacterium terricola TaxID=344163 RepID=A0ABM8DW03_9MICO|nr:YitT family protein [Microbacterium terricola]BDV29646.1 membrane protein [Microbacterium terricola]